jgi:hypothetical protein
MNMKLRAIALIALMSVLTFAANAQATRADLPPPGNFLGIATFPLWDGDAPGALGKEQADVPTITLFRPWPANSNGTAVIIAPGGGYMGLAANHEGRQVAVFRLFARVGEVLSIRRRSFVHDREVLSPCADSCRHLNAHRSDEYIVKLR